MEYARLQQLNKVVKLHSWNPKCLALLAELTKLPESYLLLTKSIELALENSRQDEPLPDIVQRLSSEIGLEIYNVAIQSSPIYHLFLTSPRFSEVPCEILSVLIEIADIRPDQNLVFHTQDLTFMRILSADLQLESVTVERLLVEDFAKLISLWLISAPILGQLIDHAKTVHDWQAAMFHLEELVAATQKNQKLEKTSFNEELHEAIDGLMVLSVSVYDTLREVLTMPPHLSTFLVDEFLAFEAISLLPEYEVMLAAIPIQWSFRERGRQAADWILKEVPPERLSLIKGQLRVRLEVIRHFLNLRKFAKLDSLDAQWPELFLLLQRDQTSLRTLEAQILQPQTDIGAPKNLWSRYQNDEKLKRFFRLRPYFRDIYPDEIERFQSVQATMPTSSPTIDIEHSSSLSDAATQTSGYSEDFSHDYQNIYIEIVESLRDAVSIEEQLFTIQLQSNGRSLLVEPEQVSINFEELSRIIAHAKDHFLGQSIFDSTVRRVRQYSDFAEEVQEVGSRIFRWFFSGEAGNGLLQVIEQHRNVRLFLRLKSSVLLDVPWETLYIPPRRVHLCLTHRYSLIRSVENIPKYPERPFAPPLRLLAVLSSPREYAPINIEGEEEILRRSLKLAEDKGQIKLEILSGRDATIDRFQRAIRTFRPHIFHFVGHSKYDEVAEEGILMLSEQDNNTARPLRTRDLAVLLGDSPLSLAVLNGCDTASVAGNDSVTGVAQGLISAGVTSVIATMTEVQDRIALMFTREYYRAMADGFPLEAALTEARKAISIENWNWVTYSLFSSAEDLSTVRLIQPTRTER